MTTCQESISQRQLVANHSGVRVDIFQKLV